MRWHRSSYGGGEDSGAIEVGDADFKMRLVRDARDPDGPELVFPAQVWDAFLAGVKAGDFPVPDIPAPAGRPR